jgi:hypothetical protein
MLMSYSVLSVFSHLDTRLPWEIEVEWQQYFADKDLEYKEFGM